MNPKTKRWIFGGFVLTILILMYLIRSILLPFVVSGVLVYLLAPVVDKLSGQRLFGVHMSRGLSVTLVYVVLTICALLLGLIVFPPLYQEVLRMANDIPNQIENFRTVILPNWISEVEQFNARYNLHLDLRTYFNQTLENFLEVSEGHFESVAGHMQKLIKLLFSALSSFLVIFIVTAFVLVDLPRIKVGMLELVPVRYRERTQALVHAIDRDLSGTIRGQLMICLINGTLTTLALLALKVKFAITIGFVAGVFSLIPVFGAVISTIPAVLIALTQSWLTALAVIGVIIIIHLIEANFLNPKILGHTVELHPSIIVFSIVVGEHFFGAPGLLFAVPVAAILRSVLRFVYRYYFQDPENLTPEAGLLADTQTVHTISNLPPQTGGADVGDVHP